MIIWKITWCDKLDRNIIIEEFNKKLQIPLNLFKEFLRQTRNHFHVVFWWCEGMKGLGKSVESLVAMCDKEQSMVSLGC